MKYKRLFAASVAAVMTFSSVAFAADADKSEPTVITYDVAVKRAIANTRDIDTLNDTIQYLDDCNSVLWSSLNGLLTLPNESYVLESDIGSALTKSNSLSSSIKKSEYQKQMLEETALYTTRNYLNTITVTKQSIDLMNQNLEAERQTYTQMQLKNKLGMVSDKDLKTEENKVNTLENNITSTKLALDNANTSFEKLIGIKNGENYVIDYNVSYEPFKLDIPLDSYITVKTATDPSIKAAAVTVSDAKYQKAVSTYETEAYSYEEKENALRSAERSKEELVKNMKVNIQNCSNNISKTDEEIKTAITAIDDAKQAYDTAKVNYEVGNITKLTLDKAALAVTSAEVALTQLYSQYDLYKIMMEHPFLITA